MSDSRSVAVAFLRDVFEAGWHTSRLVRYPAWLALEPRDRRQVTEFVYGVLRQRGKLDFYIECLSSLPFAKLDSEIVWILRLGLYQIESTRIPSAVAVSESVTLCRRARKSSAAGFVNAVLRNFLRHRPVLPSGEDSEALSVCFSHPEWLVKRYLSRYSPTETRVLMERNNQRPTPALWVNPFRISMDEFCRRLDDEGVAYEVYEPLPNCLLLRSGSIVNHPLYQTGHCFSMDVASQEVAWRGNLQGVGLLADLCSAPGGKSFLLASRAEDKAGVVCSDLSYERLIELRDRAVLYRIPNLFFLNADQVRVNFRPGSCGFVLVDAPCSGLGTLRSNPDIRWKFQSSDLPRLQRRQVRLLEQGFKALQCGAELVYATCSTEPEENEQVVETFLRKQPRAVPAGDFQRSFPEPHPGECFFSACIRHT